MEMISEAEQKEINDLREALANLIGHAEWVAAEFDVHYAHIKAAKAALRRRLE